MLPQHVQHYQALKESLVKLRNSLEQAKSSATDLKSDHRQVQQSFRQVSSLSSDPLTLELAAQVGAYQTEINKQLRLVGTDLTFLQAARQQNTFAQRQGQIAQRLEIMVDYCNTLLQRLGKDEAEGLEGL